MEQVVNLLAGWAQGGHWRMDQERDRSTSPVKSNTLSHQHQQMHETELVIISNKSFSWNLESQYEIFVHPFLLKNVVFFCCSCSVSLDAGPDVHTTAAGQ